MVEINKEKCIGCGACVKDCPGKALELKDKKAEYIRKCIQCGHYVAICPVNAVSIPDYDMAEVEEFDKDSFVLDPGTYLHAVKFRRSIRQFRGAPVEQEKLERILSAGRYTATAKNEQGCRFTLIQKELAEFKELFWKELPGILDVLEEEAPLYARVFRSFYKKHQENPKEDSFFFNTPAFLVITAKNVLDAGLAAANIENMAVAEGAGVLYSGYTRAVIDASKTLREWLGIGSRTVACCMLIGYPAVSYKRTAPRKQGNIVIR